MPKKVTLSREHRRMEQGYGKPVTYKAGSPILVDDKEHAKLKFLIVTEEDVPEKKPVPRMSTASEKG